MRNVQNRNLAMQIILTLVTCGIYGIIWFILMVDDVNTVSDKEGAMSGVMVFLLSFITCGIYSLVWYYQAGQALDQVRSERGEAQGSLGILYLVLALFGLSICSMALIQNELNKIADTPSNVVDAN